MLEDPIAIARASYQAFLDKDRAAIEELLAEEFRFTSPRDHRIDRAAFLARCWPSSKAMAGFDFIHFARDGERVLVNYVGRSTSGARFRNTELISVCNGRIVAVEAYLPWSVPKGRTRPPSQAGRGGRHPPSSPRG
jgi:ketosteroid isomerase-like protein